MELTRGFLCWDHRTSHHDLTPPAVYGDLAASLLKRRDGPLITC